MLSWFKSRIHESLAVAALFAAGVSLQAAWIANLVWFRMARVDSLMPLYVFVDTVFVIIFVLTVAWCRGRDCSDFRDRAYHFFLVSILIFSVMTLPIVYGFTI